jgi:tyrosine-protein kinase Etk/Wzc
MSMAVLSAPEITTGALPNQAGVEAYSALTVQVLINLLRGQWRLLAKAAGVGAIVGLALAFLLPVRYTAVTTILPPSASSSLASVLAAQSGELGALAGFASGGFGIHTPAQVCLNMLRSRTVEDATVQRFQLMKEYREKRLSDARKALERRTSVTLDTKSGVIAISATDGDATRAAALANGYVDEFRKFSASLAITEASQRRVFF